MIRWKETSQLEHRDVEDLYLTDRLDLLVLRAQLGSEYRAGVASRFWSAPPQKRFPPAAGHEVGTHHFGVELGPYLRSVDDTAGELSWVLSGGQDDQIGRFRDRVGTLLNHSGVRFRRAEHEGRPAAPSIIRSWESELCNSGYELGPHDDTAQLGHEEQIGFEIQQVDPGRLLATNICIEVASGGDLLIWDHRAREEDRRTLGIARAAYPYPEHFLDRLDQVRVPLAGGDIAILRGELIHAITNSPRRVVVSYFSALISHKEAIYWS